MHRLMADYQENMCSSYQNNISRDISRLAPSGIRSYSDGT